MGYADNDGKITQAGPATQTAPDRRSPKAEKAIQTTMQRGATLFFDGYAMDPTPTMGVFVVTTPERLDKSTGELYVIDYTVDTVAGTCNCYMFQRHGTCKHLIGARKRVDEAQRAYNEAVRLFSPSVPVARSQSETIIVNGRQFTDRNAADAYQRQCDFG